MIIEIPNLLVYLIGIPAAMVAIFLAVMGLIFLKQFCDWRKW